MSDFFQKRNLSSKMFLLTAFILLIVSSSCLHRPDNVLSEDEMIDLMADMQLAEAYLKDGNPGNLPESIRSNLAEAVLAKHNISYCQLDSTIAWYGRHLDDYYDMQDNVDKELSKRLRKSAGNNRDLDMSGEELWHFPSHTFISNLGLTDGLNFSILSPDIIKGESLKWNIRFSSPGDIKLLLGVDYNDGTTGYTTSTPNYNDRNQSVELIVDTSKVVTRIYGNVRVNDKRLPIWADSIRLTKLPFDSLTYYRFSGQRSYKY